MFLAIVYQTYKLAVRLSSPILTDSGIAEAHPKPGFLALTFGTLLSSQGTDAHRPGSLDPSRGNRATL
jgi:hypothetical protein